MVGANSRNSHGAAAQGPNRCRQPGCLGPAPGKSALCRVMTWPKPQPQSRQNSGVREEGLEGQGNAFVSDCRNNRLMAVTAGTARGHDPGLLPLAPLPSSTIGTANHRHS